ncbi:hypothetical protein IWX90DRAFT_322389 [Phyllosticta citrichinensis]|uniref:Uncharacterized protein n=1 Tax=Phyllosticta citrichinensis TaxID=1130410 RepID=A0ABR1XJQ0_9PEZI
MTTLQLLPCLLFVGVLACPVSRHTSTDTFWDFWVQSLHARSPALHVRCSIFSGAGAYFEGFETFFSWDSFNRPIPWQKRGVVIAAATGVFGLYLFFLDPFLFGWVLACVGDV